MMIWSLACGAEMVVVEVRMGEGITFKQNKLEDHIFGCRPVDTEMATVREGCRRMHDGHRKKKGLIAKLTCKVDA